MTRGILSTKAFPPTILYEFRLYSLGTQVVLWATIAVVVRVDWCSGCSVRPSGRRHTSPHE